jgi:hypothetical protein
MRFFYLNATKRALDRNAILSEDMYMAEKAKRAHEMA